MSEVVSLGSVNVDRVRYVEQERVDGLTAQHDWFPGPGETVRVNEAALPAELDEPDETFLGGKGSNQAVAAATAGAAATMCGRVGEDAGDLRVRHRLRERGVDATPVETAGVPTGTAHIWVTPDGETHIAILAGANGTVDEGYVDRHEAHLLDADAVLLQNEIPVAAMTTLLDRLAAVDDEARPAVVVDPAPPDGAEPLYQRRVVDVTTPNESEYEALQEAISASEAAVVRTEGAAGVTVFPEGGEEYHLDAPAVDVVDSTGAGDVLAGYLAAGLAAGDEFREAVERALVASVLSTREEGAQSAPTPEEVESFRSG